MYDTDKPVGIDLAKYLRKVGFNKPTHYYYLDTDSVPFVERGLKRVRDDRSMNHNKFDSFIYSAPSIKEAVEWFCKMINK